MYLECVPSTAVLHWRQTFIIKLINKQKKPWRKLLVNNSETEISAFNQSNQIPGKEMLSESWMSSQSFLRFQ